MKDGSRCLVLRLAVSVSFALMIVGCSKSSVDAPQSNSVSAPTAPPTTTQEKQSVATATAQPHVAAPVVKVSEPEPELSTSPSEWVELLAGNELSQWNRVPAGSADEDWTLSDGTLKCETSRHGWLVSHAQYANFELAFDFRLAKGANSGLHFHYSGRGVPADSSVEIQLIEEETYRTALKPTQRTGAVWGRVPPTGSALKPAGEWNHMLIHVEDNLIEVTLNDEKVVDVRLSELRDRPNGYVVISNWRGEAIGCEFREMRIRRLETWSAHSEEKNGVR